MTTDMNVRLAAREIWQRGVDAVGAERLIRNHVSVDTDSLTVAGKRVSLREVRRICVVGAGKAAGYLAKELETSLQPFAARLEIVGHVNVPADCVTETKFIQLHSARPSGINEPRPEGVVGAEQIRSLVSSLQPSDLCICLLTGGGSALLPAPIPGVTLDDKLRITQMLSAAGANIRDLNRVRIALSSLKGGGLARACTARQMITLIISDVIGDPLDLIASGPTVASKMTRKGAFEILTSYVDRAQIPRNVDDALNSAIPEQGTREWDCEVTNAILANNATAVDAAATEASSRGFHVEVIAPEDANTTAEEVGRVLCDRILTSRHSRPCIIWGGEPIVRLAPQATRGRGGRNQQLVLAALQYLQSNYRGLPESTCILSGGTDGEDGPTNAAGALIDAAIVASAQAKHLSVDDFLRRNDAYTFFEQLGGLLVTGPTHTNVCDLRVAVGK